ncbi:MAG: gluconate 2-dehydrogenase subunit 3 family protein [Alteromonadaceae bacterium]|nr:gluconate 2-dehydrogenase subunit 3 family protein [Alteromonadaceae bacterium]
MSNSENPSRRDFLNKMRGAAVATTAIGWLTTTQMSAALAYDIQTNSESRDGKLLSKEQLRQLKAIAQTIIPKTDTLGAGDVDCHGFIDHQLVTCHSNEEQQKAVSVLAFIDAASQSSQQRSFDLLEPQQQQALLEAIEANNGFTDPQKNDFVFLKQLVVFGYFTSQVGASETLNYIPVPGGYKPSVPVDENYKNSGTLAYY